MKRPLVTVNTLLAQVRAQGQIKLGAEALITPAAAEWLAANRPAVHQIPPVARSAEKSKRLYLVGDGGEALCRTLTALIERSCGLLEFHSCLGRREGLLAALGRVCDALEACGKRKGVVLVRDGALTQCVANKRAGVRAAIVWRQEQLAGLLRDVGLNLMIIESERVALRQMVALVETFVRGRPEMDPRVAAVLGGAAAHSGRLAEGGGHACG